MQKNIASDTISASDKINVLTERKNFKVIDVLHNLIMGNILIGVPYILLL